MSVPSYCSGNFNRKGETSFIIDGREDRAMDPSRPRTSEGQTNAHQQDISKTWGLTVSNHSARVRWVLEVATIISLDG